MNLTIYDISQKANVSIATVSRVLNGSDKVSEKTRQKVLSVIEAYGYTPNVFARSLGLNSMKTIGILCADSSDIYLSKAVYYLETQLRANGYNAILCCTGYDTANKESCLSLLLSKKVDGIILTGSHFIEEADEKNEYIINAAKQMPIMILNGKLDGDNVYCTLCDDHQSIYSIVTQMHQSHRDKIAYFYTGTSYSAQRKLEGFIAAIEAHQLEKQPAQILYYSGRYDNIDEIVHFLEQHQDFLAGQNGLVTSEDALAIGAIKYAQRHGITVPHELVVTGYNNSILATCCEPELSSVDNHLQSLCIHLVKTLLSVLNNEQVPSVSMFHGKLIERLSFRALSS